MAGVLNGGELPDLLITPPRKNGWSLRVVIHHFEVRGGVDAGSERDLLKLHAMRFECASISRKILKGKP